ncbi:hypothetical protein FQN52_008398 [Onygenales sp. PD_12]|nr:hypothetical protein FQN52_008398 [Onygenales sp. PD_12]
MLSPDTTYPLKGGCTCGAVRYQINTPPLWVNCCHCTWCQRETGTAFALNLLIESDRAPLLPPSTSTSTSTSPQPAKTETETETITIPTPSSSGRGQQIIRCATCHVALWSHYGDHGPFVKCVRVGTLDEAWRVGPDAHIFVKEAVGWVRGGLLELEGGEGEREGAGKGGKVRVVEEFFDLEEVWPVESLERRRVIMPLVERWRAEREGGAGEKG